MIMKAFLRLFWLVALPICVGCSTRAEETVLPWFKVRTTIHSPILPSGGKTSTTEYFVKVRWTWRQIDDAGVGGAIVLNPETVLYYHDGQPKLIHEGETASRLACGPPLSAASVPAGANTYDCVNVVAGPASAVATRLRIRRMSASGDALSDKTISVESPGRVFMRPMVTFYNEAGTAYFVTKNADYHLKPDCGLLAVNAGEPTFTTGPSDMSGRDCSEASAWMKVLGQKLQHVR